MDCVATVESVTPVGQSVRYRVTYPEEFSVYVVPKGSVALDGVSLTVNDCGVGYLTVNIIPSTQGVTTISTWKPGVTVNMETDMRGKYVRQMLVPWQDASEKDKKVGKITESFLRDNGF